MPTAERILKDYKSIYMRFEKLNRNLIEENTNYGYTQMYKHFEGLSEAKLCTKIAHSDYTSYTVTGLIEIDDYREPLIEILEGCEKENGKVTQKIIGDDINIPNSAQYTKLFGSISLAKLRADLNQSTIVHLRDEDLAELEDEMIKEMRRCKSKHGKTTVKLYREMDTDLSVRHITRHFGTFSKAKLEALEDPKQVHLSDSERNRINSLAKESKMEILEGLLMGDAWIGDSRDGKGYRLRIECTSKEFLEYASNLLGDVSITVRFSKDAEDLAEKNRRHGYSVNEEDIEDEYKLSTWNLPVFRQMRNLWYPDGEKRFPDDLDITPDKARIWYAGDGTLTPNGYCIIYAHNEVDRTDFMESLFDDTPFNPSFNYTGGGGLQFTKEESKEFLEWLGEPVPGYEYKWDIQN